MAAALFSAAAGAALTAALVVAVRRPGWIVGRPATVLAITALITLGAAAVLVSWTPPGLRLELDPSSEPLLPSGDPARASYRRAVREFGDDEVYVIAVASDDAFARAELESLRRTTEAIARLPGVRSVKSLADVVAFRYDPVREWIDVGPFLDAIPTDPEALATLRRRAVADPLYRRSLVSPDGRAVAVNVSFHEMTDREFLAADYDGRIDRILAAEADGNRRTHVAGRPHVKSRVYRMMIDDLRRLVPAAFAAIAVALGLLSGSLRGVGLPLAVVAVATLWTFAGVSLLERPLTVLTTLLAPTLIAIGSAYGVHVLTRFDAELRRGGDRREAVLRCLEALATPVLISGLTTSIGFAALLLSDVPAVFELGSFAILGVLSLTALSLTALPAALVALPGGGAPSPAPRRRLEVGLALLARGATRAPAAVVAAWLAVTAAGVAAIPRIAIDTDYLSYFPPGSPVRRDFEAVNRLLSGVVPIYVVLSGPGGGAFRDPAALHAMERIQRRLETVPGVTRTLSMVDFVRVLHRVVSGDDPAAERVPDTRSGVADLLYLIPKHDLGRFANANQSRANIVVRTGEVGSAAIRRLEARIRMVLGEARLPAGLAAEVTGNAILLGRSADGIASGQPRTVTAAAVAIFLLVSGALRSARLGLVAMVPNVVPVLLFFGALGWGVAPLSLPTSLIASVALGIAVDATAHYLVRYRAERLRGRGPADAALHTSRAVAPPIAIASVTLCCGFAVVAFSEFATLRQFGLLAAGTLAVCAATDLLLLPAILVRARL